MNIFLTELARVPYSVGGYLSNGRARGIDVAGLHIISKGTLLPVLIAACTIGFPAQVTSDQFHKLLTSRAAFEPADLVALEYGETAVKFLPVSDKRQVANTSEISSLRGCGNRKQDKLVEYYIRARSGAGNNGRSELFAQNR